MIRLSFHKLVSPWHLGPDYTFFLHLIDRLSFLCSTLERLCKSWMDCRWRLLWQWTKNSITENIFLTRQIKTCYKRDYFQISFTRPLWRDTKLAVVRWGQTTLVSRTLASYEVALILCSDIGEDAD